MDDGVLVPVVLFSGAATYLIRYVPVALSDRLKGRGLSPRLQRFLLALGPSAIAAMLVLSVADFLPAARLGQSAPPVAVALLVVFMVYRLTRNTAWATLAGAICYGLAGWIPGL
ncbi:MAG: AzlD domain-containing protein [Magnetospirillum sp.]